MFAKKKIEIIIPGLFSLGYINIPFINIYKKSQYKFKKNIRLLSAYNIINASIWSTNRTMKYIDRECIIKNIQLYNKYGMQLTFIFDNELIKPKDVFDTYSNMVLRLGHKKNNKIIVYSDLLEDYIKQNYPLYNVYKKSNEAELIRKKIYVNDQYNNNEIIKTIKYKNEAIIKLNPMCSSECEYKKIHKLYLANEQMHFCEKSSVFVCPYDISFDFYSSFSNKNFIDNAKLKEYNDMGFSMFLLDSGHIIKNTNIKSIILDIIESYIYYCVKEEYSVDVRKILINEYIAKINNKES